MSRGALGFLIFLGLGVGAYVFWSTMHRTPAVGVLETETTTSAVTATEVATVQPGVYRVVPSMSTVTWSMKKSSVEDALDTGTISVAEGTIEVFDTRITGMFALDMNTFAVGFTAKNPGQESVLEEHLKSAEFFDTSAYPAAEFRIKQMLPHADVAQTFTYDLTTNLTLRGITNEITTPVVLQKEGDTLVARAQFDIDRTAWGITLDSSAYFQNSGDDVLDKHITINLQLVTQPIPSPNTQHTDTENASSTI